MDQVDEEVLGIFEREQCQHDAAGGDPSDDHDQQTLKLSVQQRAIRLK